MEKKKLETSNTVLNEGKSLDLFTGSIISLVPTMMTKSDIILWMISILIGTWVLEEISIMHTCQTLFSKGEGSD